MRDPSKFTCTVLQLPCVHKRYSTVVICTLHVAMRLEFKGDSSNLKTIAFVERAIKREMYCLTARACSTDRSAGASVPTGVQCSAAVLWDGARASRR
eukprot:1472151-Pleurochrysis_carterae.AAC.1